MMGASISDVLGHDSAAHHFGGKPGAGDVRLMVIFLLLGYPGGVCPGRQRHCVWPAGYRLGLLQPSLFNAMPDRIWG